MAWAERCAAFVLRPRTASSTTNTAAVAMAVAHRSGRCDSQRATVDAIYLQSWRVLPTSAELAVSRSGRPRRTRPRRPAVRLQARWLLDSAATLGRSATRRRCLPQRARAQGLSVPPWRVLAHSVDFGLWRTTAHLHALESATDWLTHGRGVRQQQLRSHRLSFGRGHRQFQSDTNRDTN